MIDIDQLDADLYTAWKALQGQNYGRATSLVAASWARIRRFRMSLDDSSDEQEPQIEVGVIYYYPGHGWDDYVLHLEDTVDKSSLASALHGIADNLERNLRATTDRDFKALLVKALYWLRNLKSPRCYPEYNCEWVYPYGFVPEGGCPEHDNGRKGKSCDVD